ncbi:protein of unknown function [Mucilaginibacter mallensis]|uniref:DUF4249 domain-containing protein n=2 Tax=Mucilaginibacter mallensis TaxID=652787 RepID=A0A1H2A2F1_MUCMA|nr:protein of unknown function [Mucilaginibacter mallensis]
MRYMKFKYQLLIAAILLIVATSCQKVIDLKLDNAAPQLVIEGNLTDQFGPQYVIITKSVSFTSDNIFPPVTDAEVTIADSLGYKHKLGQSNPGVYSIYPFGGIPGHTYTLTVQTGGKIYTAKSTMPYPVNLDTLTTKTDVLSNKDLRTVTVDYQDPAKIANQYRFILYINGQQAGAIFTNDDSFTNGRYVKDDLLQNGIDIHPLDTATVEMECIDKNIYKYWFSLSQQQGNGPGGGTTPANPPSNFNNNALGYFSAHTTQSKAIIVK